MAGSNLIDGRAIAEQIHAETTERIAQRRARGIQPGLAFVRVGEDPASKIYVGMKERTSARLGIRSAHVGDVDFPALQLIAGRITPNPGGVGPMTIAMLMQDTVRAAEQVTR